MARIHLAFDGQYDLVDVANVAVAGDLAKPFDLELFFA
jgi:hypothetical protein